MTNLELGRGLLLQNQFGYSRIQPIWLPADMSPFITQLRTCLNSLRHGCPIIGCRKVARYVMLLYIVFLNLWPCKIFQPQWSGFMPSTWRQGVGNKHIKCLNDCQCVRIWFCTLHMCVSAHPRHIMVHYTSEKRMESRFSFLYTRNLGTAGVT